MKHKFIWLGLSFLIVAAMVLASCSTKTTNTTSASTTTTSTTTNAVTSTSVTTSETTSNVTTSVVTATTTSTGNWWDYQGIPQYGGTITVQMPNNVANWDTYNASNLVDVFSAYEERLTADSWTLNPSAYNFQMQYRPDAYLQGYLATSWSFTSPTTLEYTIRQGVYWQNIPPANGREFVASDVVYNYDRLYGLGDGFTSPAPTHTTDPEATNLISVTAPSTFKVDFNWKTANQGFVFEMMDAVVVGYNLMQNPEAVQQYGNLNNWHNAVGTGSFTLQDFVDGSSVTFVKNPNYWGYDERYPQNQLPYINSLTVLIIPNSTTALSALRTGKISILEGVSYMDSQSLKTTNPQIKQMLLPAGASLDIVPKNSVAPFNDIRVREAMQLAIDLPTIAKSYYSGIPDPWPSSITSNYLTGYGFPYTTWPASLQAEYAYNPTQAKALLAAAGFPNGFNTNVTANNTGDLSLLQIVQSYFAAVGINLSVTTLDNASWVNVVQGTHTQPGMAYNGLSGMLGMTYQGSRQIQKFTTGYGTNYAVTSDPAYDAIYTEYLASTTIDGDKQALTAANEYVAEHHFDISLLTTKLSACYQPGLEGYNGQTYVVDGSSGPQLLGFYMARFYINKNLQP